MFPMPRNEKITISVLKGELLKNAGKRTLLSTTRIRAIVFQTVLKYDKNNPNVKRLPGSSSYTYSGSLIKLREQKAYLVSMIIKPMFIKRKQIEKQQQMKRQATAAHEAFMASNLPYGTPWPINMSPEIEPLYSTLDVAKVLDIPRERLRGWIVNGFINPSIPSTGKGTIAIFTETEIRRVSVFNQLLKNGFKRKKAAAYIKEVPHWGLTLIHKYILFTSNMDLFGNTTIEANCSPSLPRALSIITDVYIIHIGAMFGAITYKLANLR